MEVIEKKMLTLLEDFSMAFMIMTGSRLSADNRGKVNIVDMLIQPNNKKNLFQIKSCIDTPGG